MLKGSSKLQKNIQPYSYSNLDKIDNGDYEDKMDIDEFEDPKLMKIDDCEIFSFQEIYTKTFKCKGTKEEVILKHIEKEHNVNFFIGQLMMYLLEK